MSAPDTKPPAKKPYQPPVLEVYGSVRDMTQAFQLTGKNDMIGGPNKTSG